MAAQAAPTNVDLPPILPKQTLAEFQSDIHCVWAVHMEEGRERMDEGNHCCCSHAQTLLAPYS